MESSRYDVFSMKEGDPCPREYCKGKLVLHEESTDANPIFYCDTMGHSFEVDNDKQV